MKKLLTILCLILFSLPSMALCSIESGESLCSLPDFRGQVSPSLKENNIGTQNPNIILQPLNRQDPIDQMRGPNNSLKYNSSCQFGICMDKPNRTLLPQSER